tara:strand:- start:855 stop:1157 length:303 start_codon:yes stop_codon:yes gene_type:complete
MVDNIIPIFKPKKVSADEVGRGGFIFSNSTISLLEANVNDWFLVAEYIGADYKKKGNSYDSTARYWINKLQSEGQVLQCQTRRLGKVNTVRLYARIREEN